MHVGCIHTAVMLEAVGFLKKSLSLICLSRSFTFFFFPRHVWLTMFNTEVKTPGPSSPANVTAGL